MTDKTGGRGVAGSTPADFQAGGPGSNPGDRSTAATKLDAKRPPCRCEPWAQRWKAESPERCVNCGGMFPAHTVEARRPRLEAAKPYARPP